MGQQLGRLDTSQELHDLDMDVGSRWAGIFIHSIHSLQWSEENVRRWFKQTER